MKAKVGISVFFEWNGETYEREIEEINIYKNYSWWGDLGFGVDTMFAVHGNLDKNGEPIMEGLVIQVDGIIDVSLHEYVRSGITFSAN